MFEQTKHGERVRNDVPTRQKNFALARLLVLPTCYWAERKTTRTSLRPHLNVLCTTNSQVIVVQYFKRWLNKVRTLLPHVRTDLDGLTFLHDCYERLL